MEKETYLGDGLYASFDGWQFRLWTQRDFGVHEVFLEPSVVHAFMEFHRSVTKKPEATAAP